uniref:Serpin domain-containing protein n=1 Tax=Glossina morsitans morsitans TaxID=37546 RepID=A0A1B0G9R6_GLOMM
MFIKQSQAQNLDRNLRDFAMKTYQEMTEGSRKFLFSPFLIHMTGAVLHLGAKGSKSGVEIDKCFHFDPNKNSEIEIADYFYRRLSYLQTSKFVRFANRIYIDEGNEMKDKFNTLLNEKFLLDVESVTFSKPRKVLARINEYTASKTGNLMHPTVYEDEFFAFEKLLAVNVLYLRGKWKTEFPPKYTSIKDFYLKKNIVVPIHMMHLKAELNYASLPQIDATVLELPYEEGDEKWSMSMLVFLPDKHTTLENVESKFYKLYFGDVLEAMFSTLVSVELPRFSHEERGDFTYHLEEMGLNRTLQRTNDFDKMVKSPTELELAAMGIQFFIDVHEEGANQAPEIIGDGKQFIANRPFMYAVICKSHILDEPLPLLMGRYTAFYDVILK